VLRHRKGRPFDGPSANATGICCFTRRLRPFARRCDVDHVAEALRLRHAIADCSSVIAISRSCESWLTILTVVPSWMPPTRVALEALRLGHAAPLHRRGNDWRPGLDSNQRRRLRRPSTGPSAGANWSGRTESNRPVPRWQRCRAPCAPA